MYPRDLSDWASSILTTVGAINWGLISISDFNLVESLFGEDTPLSNLVYGLVGIAGLWSAYRLIQRATTRPAMMASRPRGLFSGFTSGR